MTDKHPGGRPTKYDPAFCEQVIEHGKSGKSPVQIACELGVGRTTLILWADKHPEFMTALTRAKDHEQAWWEDKGMAALNSKEFNSPVWKTSMQARFRNDYTERKEIEHDATDKFGKFLAGIDGNSIPLVRD